MMTVLPFLAVSFPTALVVEMHRSKPRPPTPISAFKCAFSHPKKSSRRSFKIPQPFAQHFLPDPPLLLLSAAYSSINCLCSTIQWLTTVPSCSLFLSYVGMTPWERLHFLLRKRDSRMNSEARVRSTSPPHREWNVDYYVPLSFLRFHLAFSPFCHVLIYVFCLFHVYF